MEKSTLEMAAKSPCTVCSPTSWPTKPSGVNGDHAGSALLTAECLHTFVVWPPAAFGHDPVNDLVGIGDVARFAVHAIRKIDAQFEAVRLPHRLVNGGGTKILARIAVLRRAAVRANIQIQYVQVARLIVIVARSRVIHVRQTVECQFAVAFEAL